MKKWAKEGKSEAMIKLAGFFESGKGVSQSSRRYAEMLAQAAELGHAAAHREQPRAAGRAVPARGAAPPQPKALAQGK